MPEAKMRLRKRSEFVKPVLHRFIKQLDFKFFNHAS